MLGKVFLLLRKTTELSLVDVISGYDAWNCCIYSATIRGSSFPLSYSSFKGKLSPRIYMKERLGLGAVVSKPSCWFSNTLTAPRYTVGFPHFEAGHILEFPETFSSVDKPIPCMRARRRVGVWIMLCFPFLLCWFIYCTIPTQLFANEMS